MQFNASREVNSLCIGANLTAPDHGEALRNIMDEMLRLKNVPIKVLDMNSRGFEDIRGNFEHDFDIRRSDNLYGGITIEFDKLYEFWDVSDNELLYSFGSDAANQTSTTFEFIPVAVHLVGADSGGTLIDVPCLIQGKCQGTDKAPKHEIRLDFVTMFDVSVPLPIEVEWTFPDVHAKVARLHGVTDGVGASGIDFKETEDLAKEEEILSVSLQAFRYAHKRDEKAGVITTDESLFTRNIPGLMNASLDMGSGLKNVTLRVRPVFNESLFSSALSLFYFDYAVPERPQLAEEQAKPSYTLDTTPEVDLAVDSRYEVIEFLSKVSNLNAQLGASSNITMGCGALDIDIQYVHADNSVDKPNLVKCTEDKVGQRNCTLGKFSTTEIILGKQVEVPPSVGIGSMVANASLISYDKGVFIADVAKTYLEGKRAGISIQGTITSSLAVRPEAKFNLRAVGYQVDRDLTVMQHQTGGGGATPSPSPSPSGGRRRMLSGGNNSSNSSGVAPPAPAPAPAPTPSSAAPGGDPDSLLSNATSEWLQSVKLHDIGLLGIDTHGSVLNLNCLALGDCNDVHLKDYSVTVDTVGNATLDVLQRNKFDITFRLPNVTADIFAVWEGETVERQVGWVSLYGLYFASKGEFAFVERRVKGGKVAKTLTDETHPTRHRARHASLRHGKAHKRLSHVRSHGRSPERGQLGRLRVHGRMRAEKHHVSRARRSSRP